MFRTAIQTSFQMSLNIIETLADEKHVIEAEVFNYVGTLLTLHCFSLKVERFGKF